MSLFEPTCPAPPSPPDDGAAVSHGGESAVAEPPETLPGTPPGTPPKTPARLDRTKTWGASTSPMAGSRMMAAAHDVGSPGVSPSRRRDTWLHLDRKASVAGTVWHDSVESCGEAGEGGDGGDDGRSVFYAERLTAWARSEEEAEEATAARKAARCAWLFACCGGG